MIGEALASLKNFLGTERCYLAEKDNKSVTVIFDSIDSESWGSSITLTEHTIDKGKNITEHIKENPDTVTIKATLTNHTGISTLDPISLLRLEGLDVKDVINERIDQINNWAKEGIFLTYYGAIKKPLEGCIITRVVPSKSAANGEAVELDIELKKVEIADEDEQIIQPPTVKNVVKKGLANTALVTASVSSWNNKLLNT